MSTDNHKHSLRYSVTSKMLLQNAPQTITLHFISVRLSIGQTDQGTSTGTRVSFCLDGHRLYFGILTLGNGTNRLPRNVANKLQLLAM